MKKSKKSLKPTKKLTVSKAKKLAWKEFSLFIRTRDCLKTTGCSSFGLCITCGKRYHIKLLQAGHFLPGRRNANLFNETGCHAQCYNCNINLHGNTLVYRDELIRLHGEQIIDQLRENDKQLVQYKANDLLEIRDYYKQKIKNILEPKWTTGMKDCLKDGSQGFSG